VSIEQNSPLVIKVALAGRLRSEEWQATLKQVATLLAPHGSSVLVDAERFEGFEPGAWDDLSFQLKHDADIRRMAIVGPAEWKDRILMFVGQGLRPIDIRYFTPERKPEAREWVVAAAVGEPVVKP
jgi:hypothetical protein